MKRASLTSACLVVICLLAHQPAAHAAKRLVVMSFSGVKGVEAGNQIAAALEGRFQLISPSRFAAMARRQGQDVNTDGGRSAAAAALRVAAVVDGAVRRTGGRWILHLWIYSGRDGKILASATFPMRSPLLDPATEARVKRRIIQVTKQARAPAGSAKVARESRERRKEDTLPPPAGASAPPAKPQQRPQPEPQHQQPARHQPEPQRQQPARHQPEPQRQQQHQQPARHQPEPQPAQQAQRQPRPAGEESLGFEVHGSQPPRETTDRHGLGFSITRPPSERAPEEDVRPSHQAPPLFELLLGTAIVDRSFTFRQPIDPIVPYNFKSGLVPAALFEGELYPLAALRSALWSNLGLAARCSLVPLLKTQMLGIPQLMSTTMYDLEAGLRYRWSLRGRAKGPVLTFGGDFGRSVLDIAWPPGLSPLPPITYHFVGVSAGLRWIFFERGGFSLVARGNSSYKYSLGEGALERSDSVGFGQSDTHAVEGSLGLDAVYKGFFVRAWGLGRFIFLDFDNRCYTSGKGCKVARGAYDITVGGGLGVGYVFR